MQTLAFIDGVRWRWIGFFATILGAWAMLFAMQPDLTLPTAWDPVGLASLASFCRAPVGDASFGVVFGMWGLMSAAMMAPTALPAFKTYDDLTHTQAADGIGFAALVGGYVGAWLGFSAIAAGLQMVLADAGALDPLGRSAVPWLNAAFLAAAGLYQFSPLKAACLAGCRAPMMFFMVNWRHGPGGAWRMGLALGVICIGCCWALMLLAFLGGVMSVAWMGVAMVLMALEKMPAFGRYVTRPLGAVLLLGAAWVSMYASRIP